MIIVLALVGCISGPKIGASEPPVVVTPQICGAINVPAPAPVPVPPLVTLEVVMVDDAALVATTVPDYEATAVWLGHLGGWVDQAAAWIESAKGCAIE